MDEHRHMEPSSPTSLSWVLGAHQSSDDDDQQQDQQQDNASIPPESPLTDQPLDQDTELDSSKEATVKVGYAWRHLSEVKPVLVREIRSRGLSFQLWPAAEALCWFLEERMFGISKQQPCSSVNIAVSGEGVRDGGSGDGALSRLGGSLRGLRVLEVGSGTGLVGMLCARLGAHVTLTDLPRVLPSLRENARLNFGDEEAAGGPAGGQECGDWGEESGGIWRVRGVVSDDKEYCESRGVREEERGGAGSASVEVGDAVLVGSGSPVDDAGIREGRDSGGSVEVRPLTWGIEADVLALGGGYDLVVGADVVYYEELFEPLVQTLRWLSEHNPRMDAEEGRGEDVDGTEQLSPATKGQEKMGGKGNSGPVILLGHLRRWKKDSRFFKVARRYFHIERLATQAPAVVGHRKSVEVYVMAKKDP